MLSSTCRQNVSSPVTTKTLLPVVSTAVRSMSVQVPGERVVILGAVRTSRNALGCQEARFPSNSSEFTYLLCRKAGRDFHDFLTYWSKNEDVEVKAFTATQIPGIEGRRFPHQLCNNHLNGNRYPDGIEIFPEESLEQVIDATKATMCALAYSDVSCVLHEKALVQLHQY